MNLNKKRLLVARTFRIGKDRILFNTQRLAEIKEAITKQDIRDLVASRAIVIKDIKGRKAVEKRTSRRHAGKIRKKPKHGKTGYVRAIRRLRAYLAQLKKQEKITPELNAELRKQLKTHSIKTKPQIKEKISQLKGGQK